MRRRGGHGALAHMVGVGGRAGGEHVAGRVFDTLFICFPDKSVGGPGGVKTVFIVVDRRR